MDAAPLLRSVGVPAMAVGRQGEFEQPDRYIVRERDAHAWPEVDFPDWAGSNLNRTGNHLPCSAAPRRTRRFSPQPRRRSPSSPHLPTCCRSRWTARAALAKTAPWANSLVRLLVIFGLLVAMTIGLAIAYTSGLVDRVIRRLEGVLRSLRGAGLQCPAAGGPDPARLAGAARAVLSSRRRSSGPSARSTGVCVAAGAAWPRRTPARRRPGELVRLLPDSQAQVADLLEQYQQSIYGRVKGDPARAVERAEQLRRQILRAASLQRWQALKRRLRRSLGARHLDFSPPSW